MNKHQFKQDESVRGEHGTRWCYCMKPENDPIHDSKPVKYTLAKHLQDHGWRLRGDEVLTLDQIVSYFEPVEEKLTRQETIDLCHSITKGKKIEKIKEFFGTRGTISFETALQLANKLNELIDVVNSLLER